MLGFELTTSSHITTRQGLLSYLAIIYDTICHGQKRFAVLVPYQESRVSKSTNNGSTGQDEIQKTWVIKVRISLQPPV